jgi:hypothetical protein
MFENTKIKSEFSRKGEHPKAQLEPFILIVITLASLLIFFHFHMDSVFSERNQVIKCHTSSLLASDTLDENIDDVEYYEFLFRTCMREAGYAL